MANNTTLPVPISVPPSEYWDGNDGPWSSFWVQLGSPAQSLRLLPSTSGNALWPVLQEGCTTQDPGNCADLRGGIYKPNESSTWKGIGLYELILPEEEPLGYGGNNASFGLDNIQFGLPGDASPLATQKIVEGIATQEFYVGTIGLTHLAINLSSFTNSTPSLLSGLKDGGDIPSLTWGYTAGAAYRQPTAFGSLTLGGYDSTRFVPNTVSFPFGADISRDLLVNLMSISSNITSSPLLSTSTFMFLDSLVPDLWLPIDACKAFEEAFGLVYNSSANQYAVNESVRSSLLARNPTVTFELGPPGNSTETVNVTMHYGSFDLLNGTGSNGSNGSRVFPLRQAQNETLNTLGRVFFQDAYVTTDYERSNFSVAQAIFPDGSTAPHIVTIHPPGVEGSESNNTSTSQQGPLSHGAIAGIAIGVFVVVVLVGFLLFWWQKRRITTLHGPGFGEEDLAKPELPGVEDEFGASASAKNPPELADTRRPGLHAAHDSQELPGLEGKLETSALTQSRAELADTRRPGLHASSNSQELPTSPTKSELPSPLPELEATSQNVNRSSEVTSLGDTLTFHSATS